MHLLQQMWTSPVMEGEDPTKRMTEIRSAHAQINNSGENLPDCMLAYAMTLALPESFITIKQTLWLKEPLTSSAVQAAVQAEWTRRSTEESAMANRVQVTHTPGNNNYNQRKNKAREWTEKWCRHPQGVHPQYKGLLPSAKPQLQHWPGKTGHQ